MRRGLAGGVRWGLPGLLCAAALSLGCPREPEAPRPAPLPDAEIPALYAALTDGDTAAEEQAIAKIEAARDVRFVPVLVELLRAGQMGIGGRAGYNQRLIALERLTGKSLGGDWFGWAEWYAGTDLAPPPGFDRLTLGGLVHTCEIAGTIETDEGTLGQDAVARVPVRIVVG